MKALWAQGEASVREIREQLSSNGRLLAYTTVETIMDRLARKGAVARRKVGRAHRYTPVYQATDARAQAVQAMAQHFFGGSRRALATYLSGQPAFAEATAGRPAPRPTARRVVAPPPSPRKPSVESTERRLDTSLL